MLRRLPPISLRVRIGLIVAIHALLLLATLHVFLCGVPGASTRMYILPPADRVAAIVRAFDAAPPSAWPALVRAFGDDRQALRLLPAFPAPRAAVRHDDAAAAAASLAPARWSRSMVRRRLSSLTMLRRRREARAAGRPTGCSDAGRGGCVWSRRKSAL
ncbi:hypothetical protein CA236_13575 [Sphingomonas sp. ABOLG]|nr:hypothetical protein CA236_13575 [Sphingomonas sp. ABOLG]